MLSAVDRILAGEFNKENRFLDFSTPRIELSVHSGEISEGSFTIYGPKNQLTEGRVSSSRLRMKCLTENVPAADSRSATASCLEQKE